MGHDKKAKGQFKKAHQPTAYQLSKSGGQAATMNPNDSIGLNKHPKHKR